MLFLSLTIFTISITSTLSLPNAIILQGRASPGQLKRYQSTTQVVDWDFLDNESLHVQNRVAHHAAMIIKQGLLRKTTKKITQKFAAKKAKAVKVVKKKSTKLPLIDSISTDGITVKDMEYYGSTGIGTPRVLLSTVFDTGSSDFWLPSHSGSAGFFNTSKSSTFKATTTSFFIAYGTGNVSGLVASDTVSIGSLVVPNQVFASVDNLSSDFKNDAAVGLLGLGFSTIAETRAPTFIENLIASNSLVKNLFALHFTRGRALGSELSIGAVNPNHYKGDITYTPVTQKGFWQVQQTGFTINGVWYNSSVETAIDSGTTMIYLPLVIAAQIYAAIPGSQVVQTADSSAETVYYSYPCNAKLEVGFTFAGSTRSYAIDSNDFNLGATDTGSTDCIGTIIGNDTKNDKGIAVGVTGDNFIKNWYSVFSYDQINNAPAVGFAQNV